MKELRRLSTDELWKAIEHNAQMGQHHTNWLCFCDNIKILVAAIDERIELYDRQMRTAELVQSHRTMPERVKRAERESSAT